MSKITLSLMLTFIAILAVSAAYLFLPNKLLAPQQAFEAPEASFYGIIRSKDGNTLFIDEVQFLSGEEARRLGAQDTGCPEKTVEDCIPSLNNDFYIRNIDRIERPLKLTDAASITILSSPGSPDQASITISEFLRIYPRPGINLPFRITARGDHLLSLEEEYTP